jgi:transposase InsO family protein
MVGPQVKRQAVDVLREERGFGVTRACGLLMISRSLYGYRSHRPVTEGLRERICELAGEKRRYGYRRIHVLLRREGWSVNRKRTYRSIAKQDLPFAGENASESGCSNESRCRSP